MTNSQNIYHQRINLAVEFINKNLSQNIKLADVADAAHFSPFHFHRIFMAVLDETVSDFTNRVRLEKALRLLKYADISLTSISSACGFSSSSTFSRAFKNYFDITPSQYKKYGFKENSKICKKTYPINQYLAPINSKKQTTNFSVKILDLEERNVAFIRVYNSFEEGKVLNKLEKLVTWAKKVGIYETETFFGMSLDDIMVTPKEKYRYEVCVTIPANFKVDDSEISTMSMPQSKYATTTVSGSIEEVVKAWQYLYDAWLINSKYEPAHLHAIEFFLDKKQICNWNHFNLQLCVPIKPLMKYL